MQKSPKTLLWSVLRGEIFVTVHYGHFFICEICLKECRLDFPTFLSTNKYLFVRSQFLTPFFFLFSSCRLGASCHPFRLIVSILFGSHLRGVFMQFLFSFFRRYRFFLRTINVILGKNLRLTNNRIVANRLFTLSVT